VYRNSSASLRAGGLLLKQFPNSMRGEAVFTNIDLRPEFRYSARIRQTAPKSA
jgi:hypothetical protein